MDDLLSGVFLMVVGMGTVYLFLGLLIAVTEIIRVTVGTPAPPSAPPASGGDDAVEAAVIAAAVTHHRGRGKRRG